MIRQARNHYRISPGRLLYAALLFCGAAAAALHLAEVEQVWRAVKHGAWGWIALAAFLQFVFLLNLSAFYSAIYQALKLPERFTRLFLLVLAAAFTTVVAPGGSLSGAGLMVYDATRRDLEAARVALANVLFYLLDYLAFLLVLTAALFYLFTRGALLEYQMTAAAVLAALVAAALLLLVFSALRPEALPGFIGRVAGPFSRRLPAAAGHRVRAWEEKIAGFTSRLAAAARTMRKDKGGLARPALHALLVEIIGLFQLQALFLAFGGHPAPGQLITGYALGVLFMIVSITPSGVGIMEGAMTAAFASVGIPLEQAALATFTYRALSFWLPMAIGFLALRRVVRES